MSVCDTPLRLDPEYIPLIIYNVKDLHYKIIFIEKNDVFYYLWRHIQNTKMKKTAIILSLLVIITCSCKKKENRPFQYNEVGTLFSGAFFVSPDYFTEITVNSETGEFSVVINGHETPIEMPEPKESEIFIPGMCIYTEDLNQDGYMDFVLTPNCSAKYPPSYVYLFDKEKECFVKVDDNKESCAT